MYPYDLLPGIDLYTVCLALALVCAVLVFRLLCDKRRVSATVFNTSLFVGLGAVVAGYGSAIFFQAIYNVARDGRFVINSGTGATFYGGFIGGAVFFLLFYFGIGLWRLKKKHDPVFFTGFSSIADCAAACIAPAHAIGRVGCLFAGCCYGRDTDAWYGIYMHSTGTKVIPTQLFETVFLLLLFVFLLYLTLKKNGFTLSAYLTFYGVWRFFIEYLRDDYRGTAGKVTLFTPSQLTALILIGVGLLLFALRIVFRGKFPDPSVKTEAAHE